MRIIKKLLIIVAVCSMMFTISGCYGFGESDVTPVLVPDDAQKNVLSGRYVNNADNNIWQFNANGTLVIIDEENDSSGEYDLAFYDSSMYLTNEDGVTIQFYYHENSEGELEITINGKNADTSILVPEEKEE